MLKSPDGDALGGESVAMASAIFRVPFHMVSYRMRGTALGDLARPLLVLPSRSAADPCATAPRGSGRSCPRAGFSASTSSIFFSTSSLNGVRMLA